MTTPITPKVQLYYSGGWQDISPYVYQRDPITITRGRQNEGNTADPSTINLTVNNRDGRFSPRNPNGALYGKIGRNTPIRVLVGDSNLYGLNVSGGFASVASGVAALNITGDIDLRAELVPGDITSTQSLISKATTASNLSYQLWIGSTAGAAHLTFRWSTDGSTAQFVDHPMPELLLNTRIAVRVTMDVDNGSGQHVITFYTSDSIAGTWTLHGSVHTLAGVTSIFSTTATALVVGTDYLSHFFTGVLRDLEVRNGIGGTVVAKPAFSSQAEQNAPITGYTDSAGRAWTFSGITGQLYLGYSTLCVRATGEVSSWATTWDVSGTDVWTPIEASGIQRRLGQGQNIPAVSLLTYLVSIGDAQIVWSGLTSQSTNQTLAGPLLFNNCAATVLAGQGTLGYGLTNGLQVYTTTPVISATSLVPASGYVQAPASFSSFFNGSEAAFLVFQAQSLGPLTLWFWDGSVNKDGDVYKVDLRADGTHNDVQVSHIALAGGVGTATVLGTSSVQTALTDAGTHSLYFTRTVNGTGTDWAVYLDGNTVLSGTEALTTIQGSGQVLVTYAPTSPTGNPVSVGFIAVWAHNDTSLGYPPASDISLPAKGYLSEPAGTRINRICVYNGITITTIGDAAATTTMAAQTVQGLLQLLQEAASADMGMLYEPRDAVGLAYITRKSLYNSNPVVTLDYSTNVFGDIPKPVDDDQTTHNDVTVTGPDGSSAEAVLTSGTLSTAAPPAGINTYASSVSVATETAGPLPDMAEWLLHLGTVDESRYPVIVLDMLNPAVSGSATLTAAIRAVDVSSALLLTNPPAWLPPDNVALLALGVSEQIGPYLWKITFNCVPGSPYQVGTYGASQGAAGAARFDAENSTVNTGFASGATSLSIKSASNTQVWTTDAAAFPFDIKIAGERMTVTNITGASSPQTFTVTRAINGVVKAHLAGEQVQLFSTPRFGL